MSELQHQSLAAETLDQTSSPIAQSRSMDNAEGARPTAPQCRRPLRSRNTGLARALARLLRKTPVSPNLISVLGVVFSVAGFACLVLTALGAPVPVFFLWAAGFIQLRLLCNLMDGMVAIEGGRRSPTGELFNEAPDRIEDALFFIGAGVAAALVPWGLILGLLIALAALGTAYVRVLGASLGMDHDFCGPFAKQHRMFFLTAGCLGAYFEARLVVYDAFVQELLGGATGLVLPSTLVLILGGTVLTLVRRLIRLHAKLEAKGGS